MNISLATFSPLDASRIAEVAQARRSFTSNISEINLNALIVLINSSSFLGEIIPFSKTSPPKRKGTRV